MDWYFSPFLMDFRGFLPSPLKEKWVSSGSNLQSDFSANWLIHSTNEVYDVPGRERQVRANRASAGS